MFCLFLPIECLCARHPIYSYLINTEILQNEWDYSHFNRQGTEAQKSSSVISSRSISPEHSRAWVQSQLTDFRAVHGAANLHFDLLPSSSHLGAAENMEIRSSPDFLFLSLS